MMESLEQLMQPIYYLIWQAFQGIHWMIWVN